MSGMDKWKQFNVRLPEDYIEYIRAVGDEQEGSNSFVIQQFVYGSGNPQLPLPRRKENTQPKWGTTIGDEE